MPPDNDTPAPLYRVPPGSRDAPCRLFGPAAVYLCADSASYWPPDADLLDLARLIARDPAPQKNILVGNPARLHGFDD